MCLAAMRVPRHSWTRGKPIGGDHRRHRPARDNRSELLIKASQASSGIIDRIERLLEDDLLRRVREFLLGQPTQMCQGPMLATVEDPAMTKQKRKQLLPLLAKILRGGLARPHQITHRLVHPNRRQFTSAKQPCQRHRVTPVVLTRSPGFLGISDGATTVQS
jgi:hypothetical protein